MVFGLWTKTPGPMAYGLWTKTPGPMETEWLPTLEPVLSRYNYPTVLMKLDFLNTKSIATAAAAVIGAVSLSSCDSFIFDDLPECVPTYKVRLAFDRNMQFENRVDKVEAAQIYAFDADGNLISSASADLETLRANDWVVPVEVPRGKPSRFIVWGGLTDDAPYSLDGTRAISSPDDLTCRLNTMTDEQGNVYSDQRLTDLFHADSNLTFTTEDGVEEQTIYLTKNNNNLRLILRRQDGGAISHSDFDFFVEEDNAVMGPDNRVLRGEKFRYHPVDRDGIETAIPDGHGGLTDVSVPAAIADMHIARLTPDSEGQIIVRRTSTGEEVIRTDLMQLILAAKEFDAPDMDEQEYLDREDSFTVHLVLDEQEQWVKMQIYVNDWIIVLQSIEW